MYLSKINPAIKKSVRNGQIVWACGPITGALLLVLYNHIPFQKAILIVLFIGILASIPMYFLYPLYFKRCYLKNINRIYTSQEHKGVFGTHEMTLMDDSLIEKTEHNESKFSLKSLHKIITNNDKTYIFINPTSAYVIPKYSMINGNYDEFIKALKDQSTM